MQGHKAQICRNPGIINFVASKIIKLFVTWEMARAGDKGIYTGCNYLLCHTCSVIFIK